MQTDLVRAYYMSGGINQPYINYGVSSQPVADEEKSKYDPPIIIRNSFVGKTIVSDLGVKQPVLPPFEDKPSATDLGLPGSADFEYIDINGGFLDQAQEIDIDAGGA